MRGRGGVLPRTLRNGEHARRVFQWLYSLSGDRGRSKRLRALVTCAPFARPVQQDALLQAALDAGAVEAALLRSDAAMAVGAGLDILAPEASLLVDVGAGKISATLFTRGLVAAYAYLPYGVLRIDERLARMLRTERGYLVGPKTAEDIKQSMAAADGGAGVGMRVAGLNLQTRLPEIFEVEPEMVARASELNDTACVLAGGGALLPGLDKRIGDHLGIPCRVADAPLACAGAGLKKIMENAPDYELLILEKMARTARH